MEWAWPAVVAFCVLLTVFASVVACIAFQRAVNAQIDVKALQNSTHNIQFVPAEPPGFDKDVEQAMARAEAADYRRAGEIFDESEPLM